MWRSRRAVVVIDTTVVTTGSANRTVFHELLAFESCRRQPSGTGVPGGPTV